MVARYDVISSRLSSPLLLKKHVFSGLSGIKRLSGIKVKLVYKMVQISYFKRKNILILTLLT